MIDIGPNTKDGLTTEGFTLGGRYVVERILGEQNAGRYLSAVDTAEGGRVTIFVASPGADRGARLADSLRAEVERLRPLQETSYCTLRDAGLTEEGEAFVVVSRPQGGSLAALMRAEGRVSPDQAVSIALQICDLVRRAHLLGIYPSCVEPESIIVDVQPGGRARVSIVDLGLQRGLFGESNPRRTSLFESPQLREGQPADPRDDVFAVAALLHALIMGVAPPSMSAHGPADGSGWLAMPDETLDRRLEACLHSVLLRGLAQDRDERFPHIGALQRAFTGLRQLMSLSSPAFELLAATRSRLGQGPDALDLRVARPALDRAAEARARIREVAAAATSGAANLRSMEPVRLASTPEAESDSNNGFSGLRPSSVAVTRVPVRASAPRTTAGEYN